MSMNATLTLPAAAALPPIRGWMPRIVASLRRAWAGAGVATGVGKSSSLKDGVQATLDAMKAGRREDAAVLLFRCAAGMITRRLTSGDGHRVAPMSEEDAEDNLYPTIERFVDSRPDGRASGVNWLYQVIDSQALDFHRKRLAQKRGGDTKFEPLYTEEDEIHPDVARAEPLFGGADDAAGLDDCMERALAEYERDQPVYARVLRLVKEGLDNDDLAVAYGADPLNITEQQRKNIRQRKSHALKTAREYFEPCKD